MTIPIHINQVHPKAKGYSALRFKSKEAAENCLNQMLTRINPYAPFDESGLVFAFMFDKFGKAVPNPEYFKAPWELVVTVAPPNDEIVDA